MRTEYRIDDYQQNYFVIPSFEELLRSTVETDFAPLYSCLETLPDIKIAEIVPGDDVITHGTQDYAIAKGLRRRSFKRPPSANRPVASVDAISELQTIGTIGCDDIVSLGSEAGPQAPAARRSRAGQ